MENISKNSEVITDVQTPDTYNVGNCESIAWQEAIKKGYIKGGKTNESNKDN